MTAPSLLCDIDDVDAEWWDKVLCRWLFAPATWTLLYDQRSGEVLPALDTGHSIVRWQA